MIHGLIVDDEKITRKGMLSVIPWARFGIEIVEDLASGAAALAFLAEHPVDLVFVDVAMPGMNGIELIREMRARGMECTVVVLTFYDDFEYVREAMRLGAVDYLLKTQLDDQKILDMLGRVTGQLQRKGRERAAGMTWPASYAIVDLRTGGQGAGAAAEELAAEGPAPAARSVGKLEEGSVILEARSTQQVEERVRGAAARHGAVAVRLAGAAGAANTPPDFHALSDAALRSIVFYEHGQDDGGLVIPWDRLLERPPALSPEALEELRDGWASARWLLQEAPFRELVEMTCRVRPRAGTLEALVTAAMSELASAFPSLAGAVGAAPPRSWAGWRTLVGEAREQARRRVLQTRHSEDTIRKVLDGLDIIGRSDGRYVKEEVVAARVGLSRTYFSRCFKDITGVEFKKFLIDKSIMEAKGLLVRTTEPFRSISARLGYQSEAHFSRTFRSLTGLTPREFRTQHQSTHSQTQGDRH